MNAQNKQTIDSAPKKKGIVRKIAVYAVLIFWAFVSLFPVYWMLTFSLKNNAEIFGENVIGLPKYWVWENYTRALNVGNMPRYFVNSIVVTVATILITLALPVLIVCFIFVGGIALLIPVVMIAIAAGILKACL